MSRFQVALLFALAVCWSLAGCSAPAPPGPILVELMEEAPPRARLEGGPDLTPLTVDWAAVNGSASMPAPRTVRWAATNDGPVALVLQTPIVPVRVITLTWGEVDYVGIPRGLGREQFCDLAPGRVGADDSGCAFAERGDHVVVLINPEPNHVYVVVQIAWLASDVQQVSASWGFRFSAAGRWAPP